MKTSQSDVKDIVKELKTLGGKIDKLEKIVESRLVGEVKPDSLLVSVASDRYIINVNCA